MRGESLTWAGLLALLTWLPLPWGSNPEWARALLGVLVAGLVLARLALARRGAPLPDLPPASRLSLWLWIAWLLWIALQLAPLPAALLRTLSPASFEAQAALAEVPGSSPAWSISLLWGATLDQWLLSGAFLGLHWLVLVSVVRNRARQRLLLQVLLLSGLAQALYAIVMTLSGLELGFFAAKTQGVGFTSGTFVNQNHFASYLALTLCCGIALVLADLKPRRWQSWRESLRGLTDLALSPRLRVRVSLAVLVIALVLTRSRMGNAAFFMALALGGGAWVLLRQRRYFLPGLVLFASLFLVDLWIVSDRYGLERLSQRIQQTELAHEGRALAFSDMLPLVREYGLTGSGLGTFAAAFSPARSDQLGTWYNHAHNDHLEFLIEAGVPGYALLATLASLVFVHGLRLIFRRRDPMPCALGFAGATAVLCVAIHGLSDFILQIPAIAGTFVAIMALSLSSSSTPSAGRGPHGMTAGSAGVEAGDGSSQVG